ncbi:unnamed protein product, partial [Prorocentrum cordatum]
GRELLLLLVLLILFLVLPPLDDTSSAHLQPFRLEFAGAHLAPACAAAWGATRRTDADVLLGGGAPRRSGRSAVPRSRSPPAMPGDAAEGPPQRVWLVRHGEGTHNATGRGGVLDPPLTPAGEEQAAALRGHPELQRCELLVVSPLRRAVQTAVAAFGERPRCRAVLSALCCERWASRCDEGRPKAQLLESFPFLRGWGGTEALPEQWTPTQA